MSPKIWTIRGKLEDPLGQATTDTVCAGSTQLGKQALLQSFGFHGKEVPNPVRPRLLRQVRQPANPNKLYPTAAIFANISKYLHPETGFHK